MKARDNGFFAVGVLVGLALGFVIVSHRWRTVVRDVKAEARRSLEIANETREQLLACHQSFPIVSEIERRGMAGEVE